MSAQVAAGNVKLKQAYEPAAAGDGARILVVYSAHDERHNDAVVLSDLLLAW